MPARRNRRLSGASALADASSDEEENKEELPKPKPKGRRRLSSGAALLASDSDEEEAKPKKKTNRRRSGVASRRSFGKAALARTAAVDMSADEVAAMYSKTIKMATEGKINAKNAWNLPLIDHMRDVVKGEDSTDKKRPQRAVNFQKASCTIEAETSDEGCAVRVPSKSGMVDGARETYRGTLRVTMFDKGREVVSATTRHACLETGGEFDAEWVATSAMTEPLKSVAYNVDLERAISSRLDEARRRGVIDVPGL